MAEEIEQQVAPQVPSMAPAVPDAPQQVPIVFTAPATTSIDETLPVVRQNEAPVEHNAFMVGDQQPAAPVKEGELSGAPGAAEKQQQQQPEAENDREPVDVEMSDQHEYSDDGSEYEPEPDSPPPKSKSKQPKTPNAPRTPKTPHNPKTPKTPVSRVRSGRVERSGSPAAQGNLRCPVKGCGQTFTGRNPRQSLWHHLKYYATRGLPDRADFEKAHGEAHAEMKREAEPKGTPVERNRISSSDYRKKNPEKAKTSARLSNFRARARKKGITDEREIEEAVQKWEKEWQEKQAKEASEYFSGILLSAFE